MKKKILFSFIFIFISLFFTINVNAYSYSGSIGYNPTQPSAFPNFITDKVYYDNVRDVLFNDVLPNAQQSIQEQVGDSSEYQYMFSFFNYVNGRANVQTTVFTTEIPNWYYNTTLNAYSFNLSTGGKYVMFSRSYYNDLNRFENYMRFTNEFGVYNDVRIFNSTFSGTGYILNTNNFTLDSSLLSYLTNISSNNKIVLNFNYNNVTNYNPEYLENNSNFTYHCLNSQDSTFSIIPNTIDTSNNSLLDYYVLFPQFLYNYNISWLQFDNLTNTFEIDYDIDFLYDFKFDTLDTMSELLNTDLYVQDFNSKYPGLYNNLYGYNMFLTRFQSLSSSKFNVQVFNLNNAYTTSPYCHVVGGNYYCETIDGESGGGGGHSFGESDSVVDIPTGEICFYIPSTTYLKVWNVNDFGDIDDTIDINGTDYDINTDAYENAFYNNVNNNSYSGFIGYFKTMLSRLSYPILFINSKITLLFNSLPQDLQFFIIGIISLGFLLGLIKFLTGGK